MRRKKIPRDILIPVFIMISLFGLLLFLSQLETIRPGEGWATVSGQVAAQYGYVAIIILGMFGFVGIQAKTKGDMKVAGTLLAFMMMGAASAGLARSMYDAGLILDEITTYYTTISIEDVMAGILLLFMTIGGIIAVKTK